MRTLYFDCFAGASGDMILGALLDAGLNLDELNQGLSRLGLKDIRVEAVKKDKAGIAATYARVLTAETSGVNTTAQSSFDSHTHSDSHSHAHGDDSHEHLRPHAMGHSHAAESQSKKHTHEHHRGLTEILEIIAHAELSPTVKARAARIFQRLGEVEARVHNVPLEEIHFHEVGALDAIADVVGACLGFELLGIERFIGSPLHVGSGFVEMAHGRYPVPPPAVAALLSEVPHYGGEIRGELVTPTGAAIISTLCESYGALPYFEKTHIGYGAGTREYSRFPNVLRIFIGSTRTETGGIKTETLNVLETNLDDMTPEHIGYTLETALERGALDCWVTPAQMKKNRPGVLLSLLCRRAQVDEFCEWLFTRTTTLGVRVREVERRSLERENLTGALERAGSKNQTGI